MWTSLEVFICGNKFCFHQESSASSCELGSIASFPSLFDSSLGAACAITYEMKARLFTKCVLFAAVLFIWLSFPQVLKSACHLSFCCIELNKISSKEIFKHQMTAKVLLEDDASQPFTYTGRLACVGNVGFIFLELRNQKYTSNAMSLREALRVAIQDNSLMSQLAWVRWQTFNKVLISHCNV